MLNTDEISPVRNQIVRFADARINNGMK